MLLRHVSLGGLRVFAEAEFFPGPGLTWLIGSNGAGKSSVLEALYALSHARSFRAAQFDSAIRSGSDAFVVFTEWSAMAGGSSRLAAQRVRRGGWEYRINGEVARGAAEIAALSPMLCFEPGSHALITGGSEFRRRLLDWGVFHVERAPASLWLEWGRALRQRNELLRIRDELQLEAFDPVVADLGERLAAWRGALCAEWLERVGEIGSRLSPELVKLTGAYRTGWGSEHDGLLAALRDSRTRDIATGYSSCGPQRADVAFRIEKAPARERLSRGQTKLLALCLMLGLAELYAERHSDRRPLLLLDDLLSELDASHASAVLAYLRETRTQAVVTGVARPTEALHREDAVFHVERGVITPLL